MNRNRRRQGFTLIELLVVIAIVALLIGILLPALGSARAAGRSAKAAANLRTIAQGVAIYVSESDFFPPSYVYAAKRTGGQWNMADQLQSNPNPANGYIHWSWSLFGGDEEGGGTANGAFSSPAVSNGGAPRTNPGREINDWEDGQINDLGQRSPAATPMDRQASRVAYTGNAAIFPRNKFAVSSARKNRMVRASNVDNSVMGGSRIILATEYYDNGLNWTSLTSLTDGRIKSHRPVTPFIGRSSGSNVYAEPTFGGGGTARFVYPPESAILEKGELGANMINNANSTLNAVGRHHPGNTTNFVFVDGHVAQMKLKDTIKDRLWGDRFFSITGNNRVDLEFNSFK